MNELALKEEINIENIILIPNPSAPDAGVCFSYNKENTNNKNSKTIDIKQNSPI